MDLDHLSLALPIVIAFVMFLFELFSYIKDRYTNF